MLRVLLWFVLGFILVGLTACSYDKYDDTPIVYNNSTQTVTYDKSVSYDSLNRVTKEDLGNGSYIEYTYDDSGNLISQKVVQ
jgi:YD repeat-containing protein